jgi:hypothetical protein
VTLDRLPPPALGVNVNVAATPALLATRSPAAMMNVTADTAPPILPLDTAGLETVGSVSVRTVTEDSLAALATPIVQPKSVTVTALVDNEPLDKANTMDVAPSCEGVSVAPAVDTLAVGVGEVAKKPDG